VLEAGGSTSWTQPTDNFQSRNENEGECLVKGKDMVSGRAAHFKISGGPAIENSKEDNLRVRRKGTPSINRQRLVKSLRTYL